ncbi:hypothetical protein [Candidatus Enterococcus lemimoniae]|uniref:Uncharacterized protein n=1 Tax=Candidatus Enterococcus lemimoniae TaxID=1834167 RepID=A0ABZ2T375_9ENTE|nr:hypothetical protein [Enterococcus sp. 12C11_DIV0727]OTO68905.1 hypothetical protein A5866_001104 [Enterococcus sp. 12C11_DIV0727]
MNTSDWLSLLKPLLENKAICLVVEIMFLNYLYKISSFGLV